MFEMKTKATTSASKKEERAILQGIRQTGGRRLRVCHFWSACWKPTMSSIIANRGCVLCLRQQDVGVIRPQFFLSITLLRTMRHECPITSRNWLRQEQNIDITHFGRPNAFSAALAKNHNSASNNFSPKPSRTQQADGGRRSASLDQRESAASGQQQTMPRWKLTRKNPTMKNSGLGNKPRIRQRRDKVLEGLEDLGQSR